MVHFVTIGIHLRIWPNLGMDAFSQVPVQGDVLVYLLLLCPRIVLDRRLQEFLLGIVSESEVVPLQ